MPPQLASTSGSGGHGSRFRCTDTGWARGAVLPCGGAGSARDAVPELALVGNGIERVGCDAGTRAQELRPDAGLGLDIRAWELVCMAVIKIFDEGIIISEICAE
jgi:hypothetical protein